MSSSFGANDSEPNLFVRRDFRREITPRHRKNKKVVLPGGTYKHNATHKTHIFGRRKVFDADRRRKGCMVAATVQREREDGDSHVTRNRRFVGSESVISDGSKIRYAAQQVYRGVQS